MKKILVPCDFSFAAKQAYKFALDIATANSGEVLVVYIVEVSTIYGNGMAGQPYKYVDPISFSNELNDELNHEFEAMKNIFGGRRSGVPAAGAQEVPVYFSVELGEVTGTIISLIAEHDIDLVVMGTEGASGLKEFFIGSNTEKIVRTASVPVFAIHKAQELSEIRNIIFPTTFDLNQSDLISKIKGLQTFFDAVLHVLYVNTPESHMSDKEANINLRNFASFYGLGKYQLHIRHDDREEDGILKMASGLDHSIIAMATHGHKGITHLLAGSIAEDVVNHAQEQVWTYSLGQEMDS